MISILERLTKARVFAVSTEDDGYLFLERCDAEFGLVLSADEVRQLAAELISLVGESGGR